MRFNGEVFSGKAVTQDVISLVACHELGHHIGGYPKKTVKRYNWASVEGQADYYSTAVCMRQLLQNEDNISFVSQIANVDQTAQLECSAAFPNDLNSRAICIRSTMAALAWASDQAAKSGLCNPDTAEKACSLTKADKSIVAKTLESHPETQCRLDILFAGALCPLKVPTPIDQTAIEAGFCSKHLQNINASRAARPMCWYNEPASEEK